MGNGVFTTSLLLAIMAAFGAACLPCAAQGVVSGQVGALNATTDVIVGHGNKGPYTLTWNQIAPQSVTVVLNGRTLRRGREYNVDPGTGVISFNTALATDAIVRVSYQITPGKSQHNTGKTNLPITLDVVNSDRGKLQLTGLYAQEDPGNPGAGKSVIGIGGERHWGLSSVSTQFLTSQSADPNAASAGSTMDRTALKLGARTECGALRLTGNYVQTGGGFLASKEYGLGLGRKLTDFGAVFAPGNALRMEASFRESEDTDGAARGAYTRVSEQNMTLAPGDSTRLALGHTVTEKGNTTTGAANSVEANRLTIDQKVGTATSAQVVMERARVDSGTQTDQVQTRQVSVATQVVPRVDLKGTVKQTDSALNGAVQSIDVAATASPMQEVALQVGYSGAESARDGHAARTDVAVQLSRSKNLTMQGRIAQSKLNDTEQFQRDFTLTGAPARFAKLSAVFSQNGAGDCDNVTKGGLLEINPASCVQLSAGWRYAESAASALTVRDYAAVAKPFGFMSLSGRFRDREAEESLAPDTKALQLAVSPFRFLDVTGGYESNPEDEKGVVQSQESSRLGVNMRVGSFGLLGDFAAKDEYMARRLSDERRLGLEMPFFRAGTLTTGYKVNRLLDGSRFATRIYSLGYRHAVGSDFSLSLTGHYTERMQDSAILKDKSEYSAEASLGVRF